jgi:hypothetical protein
VYCYLVDREGLSCKAEVLHHDEGNELQAATQRYPQTVDRVQTLYDLRETKARDAQDEGPSRPVSKECGQSSIGHRSVTGFVLP